MWISCTHLKINMFKILPTPFLFLLAPIPSILPISIHVTSNLQNCPNHNTGCHHLFISLKLLKYLFINILPPKYFWMHILTQSPYAYALVQATITQSLLLKLSYLVSPPAILLSSYLVSMQMPYIAKCPSDHVSFLLKTHLLLSAKFR